jgi:hypothetical protein
LTTFNRQRFRHVIELYKSNTQNNNGNDTINPTEISIIESSVWAWFELPKRVSFERNIQLGVRLSELCFDGLFDCSDLESMRLPNTPYIITCDPSSKSVRAAFATSITPLDELRCLLLCSHIMMLISVYVFIHSTTTHTHTHRCFYHSLILIEAMHGTLPLLRTSSRIKALKLIEDSKHILDKDWDALLSTIINWDLRKVSLGCGCWRYLFQDTPKKKTTCEAKKIK